MGLLDYIRRKRLERLVAQGTQFLREEQFDRALGVADKLRRMRFSAAFEIGALAFAGKGQIERAIEELEAGVERAPEVWVLWQLLGNYRSDLERYAEAQAAYRQALECPDVWSSSVRLNQAILANRSEAPWEALSYLEQADDPDLGPRVALVRMDALRNLGRSAEAEDVAAAALAGASEELDDGLYAALTVELAQIRVERGRPRAEVRGMLLDALRRAWGQTGLLWMIRELDAERSPDAWYFRMLLHARIPEDSSLRDEAEGYFLSCEIVADTMEEALELARGLEDPELAPHLAIEEAKSVERSPQEPKGVYRVTPRIYYSAED